MNKTSFTLLVVSDWLHQWGPVVALATMLVSVCAVMWMYVNPWPNTRGYSYQGRYQCAMYSQDNSCLKWRFVEMNQKTGY